MCIRDRYERDGAAVHLQVPRVAVRARRLLCIRAARGRVLQPRQGRLRVGTRALRCVRGLHLRELLGATGTVAPRVPRPDAAWGGGLPLRADDRPVRLPSRVSLQLEGVLGRLHGVLPCTRCARRPALEPAAGRDHTDGIRGAALSGRRCARVGYDGRLATPGVGYAEGEREAGRPRHAKRTLRPVGQVCLLYTSRCV